MTFWISVNNLHPGGTPGPLPFRVDLPDGTTRTDLANQLAEGHITIADLRAWGWWPVTEVRPAYDPATQHLVLVSTEVREADGDVLLTYAVEAIPPPPPPTVADVIAERNRRLALGFDYDFGDARGVHRIATTPDYKAGWDEVTKASKAALALGEPGRLMGIKTETATALVTALEWQEILLEATDRRQPIWKASFDLQDMTPIPADYADDIHWPAAAPPT